MGNFVGLDVSLETVSICIVNEGGLVVWEGRVAGEPDAVLDSLRTWVDRVSRIGLEAGPTSEWIAGRLLEAGLPVVCLETRHVKAALSAMTVKTDRNDARGIAQIVRSGWFKVVHLKSASSQRLRTLAAARKVMVRSVTAAEQALRGLLRPFGLKVGAVTRRRFGDRVRTLVEVDPLLATIVEPLLRAHERLRLELCGAASAGSPRRSVRCGLPTSHDHAWDRPGHGADLQSHGRRPKSLPSVEGSRCLSRTDSATLSVRRDRSRRPHHQGWRQRHADGALRGGKRHSAARPRGGQR